MKTLYYILGLGLLITLSTGCKTDTNSIATDETKEGTKPVVIKEVKFPDGKKTTPPKSVAKPKVDAPTAKPAPPAANGGEMPKEDQALYQAHRKQQSIRDNNVREIRKQLMSKCLMGVAERPMLRFTISKTGEITDYEFLSKTDQSGEIKLPQDLKTCLEAIINKQQMGPLDVKRPDRKVQETITVTIPL